MNRGATWAKWDLHVHTPASYEWQGGKRLRDVTDEAERDDLMRQVVEAINASGCAAVAVMDYWTFDGVDALRRYLEKPGAVACNATIFPGIELRMVSPGDFRLNMHVLLNPELTTEKLSAFKSRLTLALSGDPLADDYLVDYARVHISDDKLKVNQTSKAEVTANRSAALTVASKVAEVTRDSVIEALKQFGEQDAILFVPFDTNDGVKKINFREHYNFPRELLAMEAVFEVTSVDTRDAFVGIKTPENEKYFDEFKAATQHPKLAVRGSDAHSFSDYGKFPGNKITWIKAKPTFAGLLQTCKEPANRSFIGELPPKLDFVSKNPHLFAKAVRIRKQLGAPEPGEWFNGTDLELNHDLVALIGRKGSGKSALADVLGVLGDTPNEGYLSFLSPRRFRLPKDNKASSFEAQIEWEQDSKTLTWRPLSAARSPAAVQRIKYLPQSYFEDLCNDHVRGDDSLLQGELRTVIFSHLPVDERDGTSSLDELIELRTGAIDRDINALRTTLAEVNSRIVTLGELVDPDARKRTRESIKLTLVKLRALLKNKPVVAEQPKTNDPALQEVAGRIAQLNDATEKLKKERADVQAEMEGYRAVIRAVDATVARLGSFEKLVETERAAIEPGLATLGLKWHDIVALTIDKSRLTQKRADMVAKGLAAQARLNPQAPESIAAKLMGAEAELAELKPKLDEPMLRHQQELAALREWESQWAAAVGSREDEESFRGLWARMRSYPAREAELADLKARRLKASRDILHSLHQKAGVLTALFAPVQALVDEEPEIKEALGVSFSVRFLFDSFATLLFDHIKQQTGSFAGVEESKALIARLLASHDLTAGEGLEAFLGEVDEALTHDVRSGAKRPVKTASLLRSERSLADLYNFVFGLEYADLSYGLLLGNVELERLSPGQRGALLLIFYFLVDRDRIPIVLDQPEENLDNETVYKLLVRVITRAKQHRQVIMATHNANLAVACDAEQVIVCTMDRDGSNRIHYLTGAIEELDLNQAVVDILEGTRPAFENRRRKYKYAVAPACKA